MMMNMLSPGVQAHLIRDLQERMRPKPRLTGALAPRGVRVRLGHALIAVGSALSGERVERPVRHSSRPI